jgi:hypothetical protein
VAPTDTAWFSYIKYASCTCVVNNAMNTNLLNFVIRATNVNGWPCVKIKTSNTNFKKIVIDQELTKFVISVPTTQSHNSIILERYNKTEANQTQTTDQIIEILSVSIDNVAIPNFIFEKFSKFEFDHQCHNGSRYFSPNGVWTFVFQTPLITWILDQRILHESQYNQDYIYPWSYKFGPRSVNSLTDQLTSVYNKVQKIL